MNQNMRQTIRKMDGNSRRSFLTQAASGLLGVGMLTPLGEQVVFGAKEGKAVEGSGTAKNVIYIYLSGGMSHIDTFDPKPEADTGGEFSPIKTSADGIRVSEHLPLLAKQMKHCTVINSMTSKQGAHERGRYLMHTSYNPLATIQHASIGAWVSRFTPRLNMNLPSNIVVGNGGKEVRAGFLGSQHEPLVVGDPNAGLQNIKLPSGVTDGQFDHRRNLLNQVDSQFRNRYKHNNVKAYTEYYDEAVRMMRSADVQAFDIKQEPSAVTAEYGEDRFARGCLLARRLVEHGVRFIEVTSGGWDTHQDNFERLEEKLPAIDRGVSALINDLARRGLLQTTMVVLTTEFGRTPRINERGGRDHYPKVFSAMVAGGGIKGGRVYGASDDKGATVKENAVTPADLNASIAYAMGVDHRQKVISSIGRPFTLSNEGTPVTALFS